MERERVREKEPVQRDEHQHFNKVQGNPAKWMAFRYNPFARVLGNMFQQVEESPDWKGEKKGASA